MFSVSALKEFFGKHVILVLIGFLLLPQKETVAMPQKTFKLELSGEAGVAYEGSCTLETEAGNTEMPLAGALPQSLDIIANALTCQIKSEGRLIVEIQHDKSRTRSATNGGTIRLSLR